MKTSMKWIASCGTARAAWSRMAIQSPTSNPNTLVAEFFVARFLGGIDMESKNVVVSFDILLMLTCSWHLGAMKQSWATLVWVVLKSIPRTANVGALPMVFIFKHIPLVLCIVNDLWIGDGCLTGFCKNDKSCNIWSLRLKGLLVKYEEYGTLSIHLLYWNSSWEKCQ